jgi:chromosome segregation ATPase
LDAREKALEQCLTETEKLQARLEEEISRLRTAEESNRELKSDVSKLTLDLDSSERDGERMQQELTRLRLSEEGHARTHSTLQGDLKDTQKSLEDTRREFLKFQTEHYNCQSNIMQLESTLSECKAQMSLIDADLRASNTAMPKLHEEISALHSVIFYFLFFNFKLFFANAHQSFNPFSFLLS